MIKAHFAKTRALCDISVCPVTKVAQLRNCAIVRCNVGVRITVVTVTTPRVGRSGDRLPARAKLVLFSSSSRPPLKSTMPHIQWISKSLPCGKADGELTTRVHLMLRLRMSGVIPLPPFYVFMTWTGTALHIPICVVF